MTLALSVVAEDEARIPRAVAVRDGRRRPLNVSRLRSFGVFEMTGGDLRRPVRARIEADARGPRIDASCVEIPPFFVRLSSVKSAEGVPERSAQRADGDHAAGDVRRVLHVMAQRRLRDLRC